jgi:hypothetical protein
VLGSERVGLGLDAAGFGIEQQRAVAVKDLQPVPLGRIVAGGEGQSVGRAALRRGVGDQRRGRIFGQQYGWDVVAGEDLGGGFGGLP